MPRENHKSGRLCRGSGRLCRGFGQAVLQKARSGLESHPDLRASVNNELEVKANNCNRKAKSSSSADPEQHEAIISWPVP